MDKLIELADQFAARFGATQSDIDQTTAWLRGQGLTVQSVGNSRNWIAFGGTAEQVGRALHTQFHYFVNNGQTHFAAAMEPSGNLVRMLSQFFFCSALSNDSTGLPFWSSSFSTITSIWEPI